MTQQSGMFTVHQTVGSVLCCKCGVPMAPNAANMCVTCLRSEVDITEGLQKQVLIIHCPECDCYLQPPKTWLKAQWESKELLTFCVKRLKNLNKVRLVHAEFVWTEPHSKRIKVKLRVQKEVLNGAVLEQAYIVEYTIRDQMCDPCSRIQANPDQWIASVQLRQHVPHRRTFFYLEQLILKHDAASRAISCYLQPPKTWLKAQLESKELLTFCVKRLKNLNKVSDSITLLDPMTLRHTFLDAKQYWRYRFRSALSSRQLVKYFVFDVEPPVGELTVGGTKYALSYAQVARESDIGKIFYIPTHLGHILKPGDQALGYDLYAANVNDNELEKRGMSGSLPEVILIKKSYEAQRERKKNKPRSWKLKSLPMETSDPRGRGDEEKMSKEYEEFLRDLEENPELRFNVSLYRDKDYQPSETASMTDGEGAPSVPIEELLIDLKLSDEEEEEDEDEEDMDE
ncbi:PREDICTED: 60S ribosomal export protein NMD3-like [Tarenaya hassleriana]|uniref:60S ribosomal export protein NMD3-like n=1 Tax=Tarenaya hassleriana TaxID=28532 RepID=UPI00053C53DC|nr:PREDICTED: 60S ribosomal export protein NMD3-like [Tarenaya hassleriana]